MIGIVAMNEFKEIPDLFETEYPLNQKWIKRITSIYLKKKQ
ncbi:hypothetical protein [Tenacibaculum ovolyticum]|nr:hypothetical protein [Tenacibaculum ovolyticum]